MADFEVEKICRHYSTFDEVIADTTRDERELCTSLNLHSNKVKSCAGLDASAFPALRELNLSSNQIASSDLPEISYLQSLQSLDLSGNSIRAVEMLPFLPGLQRLAIAFNPIQSLLFLNEAVPNLRVLDIRGHKLPSLRSQRHFLSPLSCLVKLQELLLVGKAREVSAADVLGVFAAVPSLQQVDGLREEQWRSDFEHENTPLRAGGGDSGPQLTAAAPSAVAVAPAEGLVVDTPKFDEVSKAFKQRLLSSSGGDDGLDRSADRSAFSTGDYPPTPAAIASQQKKDASCSPLYVDNDWEGEGGEPRAQQGGDRSALLSPLALQLPTALTDECASAPEPFPRSNPPPSVPPPPPPPRPSALQLSLARMNERYRMRCLHRAFSSVRLAHEVALAAALEAKRQEEKYEHTQELELLGKRLLQERCRADSNARRLMQCEAVQMGLRRQLGTAAAEAEMLQRSVDDSTARAGEQEHLCVELTAKVQEVLSVNTTLAEDRDMLRKQCEQLRSEHSFQAAAAQAETEARRLEVQQLQQQLKDRENSFAEQTNKMLDLSRQSQAQLQEALAQAKRGAEEREASLQAVSEASQGLAREERVRAERAEEALAAEKEHSSRAERRMLAAQHAFEQGAKQIEAVTYERQALHERNVLLTKKVEDLSVCVRRLQVGLQQAEQRVAEQKVVVLRSTSDKGVSPLPSPIQKTDEKTATAATAATAKLTSQLDALEVGLVNRTEELLDTQRRLAAAESHIASSDQKVQDLQLAVRVKEKMLEDQAIALSATRSKLSERDREVRRLGDALSRAEARLDRCSADAVEMEEELAAKARVERELKRLLEEVRSEGAEGSGVGEGSPLSANPTPCGECRNPVCARERSRLAAETGTERVRREAAERAAEGATREGERAAAASALLHEQARVLSEEKQRCEAALLESTSERRALQRAVKRLEGECLRRDEELHACRKRVGLLKNALVDM